MLWIEFLTFPVKTDLRSMPQNLTDNKSTSVPMLGLRPANERWRYKVTPSLIGWTQIESAVQH